MSSVNIMDQILANIFLTELCLTNELFLWSLYRLVLTNSCSHQETALQRGFSVNPGLKSGFSWVGVLNRVIEHAEIGRARKKKRESWPRR